MMRKILVGLSLLVMTSVSLFSHSSQDREDYYFKNLRKDFPYLDEDDSFVYFDSGATTQKPRSVINKMKQFYESQYASVHRGGYKKGITATYQYNAARKKIQSFINARSSQEIIFTRGTTDSINLLANSFGKAFIREGDEIIISEMEHHSNIIPWQILARDKKAIIKVIPINSKGELILAEYEKILSPKTRLVSVAHVANSTGTINPIEYIIKKAHKVGAKVMIDGAQAIAHMPVDVKSLDADFYVFSAHKLYGPSGLGVLYGKKHLLERMPPSQGGGDMGLKVTMEDFVPKELPLKFEAGTPPIAQVVAFGEAISYIDKIGRSRIANREHALLVYATEKMEKIPNIKIVGTAARKAGIICFAIDKVSPFDIESYLDSKNIAIRSGYFCAQPTLRKFEVQGAARVSLGIYNTFEEVDYFVDALTEAAAKLSAPNAKWRSYSTMNDEECIDTESPDLWY